MEFTSVSNPRFNRWGTVDMEVHFASMKEPITFSASPDDTEAHGRELYHRALAGQYGPIAEHEVDIEEVAEDVRQERDRLLAESDVYVLPDRWALMTPEEKTMWSIYRQDLRDLTEQPGFPLENQWPIKPN